MISVLIPTYNYHIVKLVNSVHEQLEACDIDFEIIGYEDGSTNEFIEANTAINHLPHTQLLVSKENVGRIKARQALCDQAQYEWLLFLDADVFPSTKNFITNYKDQLASSNDALFGGICYHKDKPQQEYMLRWKYGIQNEEAHALERNRKPYKLVVSANMLIRKNVFNSINSLISYTEYGMDNFFGSKLKELHTHILHIDNPVFHLGLENNNQYLKKKEAAASTLLYLLKHNLITVSDNNLLELFLRLKKWKLNYLVAYTFKMFRENLKKNLLGKDPSIKLLQYYRIGYICYIDLNRDA